MKYKLAIIGTLVGGIAGYAYYYFVGCATGSCPIASNPFITVVAGMIMGYLLFDLFKRKGSRDKGDNN